MFFWVSPRQPAHIPPFPIPGFWEHINLPLECDVSDEGFRIPAAVTPKNRLEIGGQKPV
jgi:hypothetical protein